MKACTAWVGGSSVGAAASAWAWSSLQLGQLQLELVGQRAALRRLAEPFVPEPGDLVLELLDQQRLVAALRTMRLPFGQQHRLQRRDVVGEGFSSGRAHRAIVAIALCPATATGRLS